MFQPIERRKNRRSGNSPGLYDSLDRRTLLVLLFISFCFSSSRRVWLAYIYSNCEYVGRTAATSWLFSNSASRCLSLPKIGPHPPAIPVPGQSWEAVSVLRHAVSAQAKACPLPTGQTQDCPKIKFTIFVRDTPLFSIFHFLGPFFFFFFHCCPVFLSRHVSCFCGSCCFSRLFMNHTYLFHC